MTSEQLKTFIFLSKVKNFTICARQMCIAQSTVTNRIYELEKEVGKKLFRRGPKFVELTNEGKIFLNYANRMLELEETSIAEMNAAYSYTNKVSVGAINSTYECYVKPIIDECIKSKDSSVSVMLSQSLDLIQLLQDNVLNIVFCATPLRRNGYECKVYDTDKLVLVTSANTTDYADGITREEMREVPYLMCNFSFSEFGTFMQSIFPEGHVYKLEVDNSSKLIPYLKLGVGFSFLPYKFVKERIKNKELREVKLKDFTAPNIVTYVIYKENYNPSNFLKYGKTTTK